MNPLTNVKNIQKLSEQELVRGGKSSWHDQYKDSAWIFIGGLPFELSEGDIITVFSQYGEVAMLNLIRDKDTGKSRGFGFLCYEDQRSTTLAVDNFNGMKLLKRTIRVDHVADYKVPKLKKDKNEKGDSGTDQSEERPSARPLLIKQELEPSPSCEQKSTKEKKKKKKSKKKLSSKEEREERKKRCKKKQRQMSSSSSDSEEDSDSSTTSSSSSSSSSDSTSSETSSASEDKGRKGKHSKKKRRKTKKKRKDSSDSSSEDDHKSSSKHKKQPDKKHEKVKSSKDVSPKNIKRNRSSVEDSNSSLNRATVRPKIGPQPDPTRRSLHVNERSFSDARVSKPGTSRNLTESLPVRHYSSDRSRGSESREEEKRRRIRKRSTESPAERRGYRDRSDVRNGQHRSNPGRYCERREDSYRSRNVPNDRSSENNRRRERSPKERYSARDRRSNRSRERRSVDRKPNPRLDDRNGSIRRPRGRSHSSGSSD